MEILRLNSGRSVVNLYCSPAGLIHLLRGDGIEVGNREGAPNPFRGNVLHLRPDNGEYGREQ